MFVCYSDQPVSNQDVQLETIVNLAKRRGFIFPGSEMYGGLANSWDYGPLGTLLKNNIREAWWRHFVTSRDDIVPLDSAILMNPKVWEVSGHVANFNDPMVEDKVTHKRYRADHVLAAALGTSVEHMTLADMKKAFAEHRVKSPDGNELTEPRVFNLLFETSLGSVESEKQKVYLRGELAQAMFVDFKYIADTMRLSLPFGIAQVGKVFRNEVTPGNFTFRTLEFDLMEFEYFVREKEWETWFGFWLEEMQTWLDQLGLNQRHVRIREHTPQELAHYSKKTVDVEYQTPFGWKELLGLAYRGDFDLKNHSEATGFDLRLADPATGAKVYPHVIEPTFGLTRLALIVMLAAYHEEEVRGEKRVVMKFPPLLAPYQVAVLPLSKKKELIEAARPIASELRQSVSCDFDVTQSIGKRYRRQDEIGTPYCVTVDFDSLEDKQATVRERDTMSQERVPIDHMSDHIRKKFEIRK